MFFSIYKCAYYHCKNPHEIRTFHQGCASRKGAVVGDERCVFVPLVPLFGKAMCW